MQSDPTIPPSDGNPLPGGGPPPLPPSGAPVNTAPPPPGAVSPPPPLRQSGGSRQLITIVLSLCLGLFLADGVLSLADDSLTLLLGNGLLSVLRGIVSFPALFLALLVYGLMGLTPMIPKRLFVPLVLFAPLAQLAMLPVCIYAFGHIQQAAWVLSLCQVALGVVILHQLQGGFKLRWPLVAEQQLESRRFSWLNLLSFVLVNVMVVGPAVMVYLVLCARLAVDHFSDGFLALHTDRITVQVRKYIRNDGKTIQLVPMSHVGEPEFYHELSQSFPTNSLILMEGVTDERNLLTNKLTYTRAAASLGLAEQQKEFKKNRGEWVRADVDVAQFTTNTIDFLNLVTLIHAQGLTPATLLPLTQYSAPSGFQEELFEDLLQKRNRRVLEEIQARLPQSDLIIVPWGAAHMPGISKQLQASGFRLTETHEYTAIRFRSRGKNQANAVKGANSPKPK